jgi:hypothetical protein
MTSDQAIGRWLEPRLTGAPAELAEAVRGLVREVESTSNGVEPAVPDILAAAALLGFDGVLDPGDPPRETALRLLAADAALTYAFEAAATLGTDVGELALRLGPRGELGRRLASQRSRLPDGGVP